MQRPRGITFLAVLNYFVSAWTFAMGIAALIGPRALGLISMASTPSEQVTASDARGTISFLSFVASLLIFFVARGLWGLKSWARNLVLVFTIMNLIGGGWGSWLDPLPSLFSESLIPALWPHSFLVTSGIIIPLVSRAASLTVLVYLLAEPVKQAFLAKATEWKWLLAVGALALLLLGHDIYKSGPELRAIRYHMRYGNQVAVNGVDFPVYFWHAPKVDSQCPGFAIDDEPGPLRPDREDRVMFLEVSGYRKDKDLPVDQLVEDKIQSFKKSGYTDLSTFHIQVANQSLSCMKEASYAPIVYCYGGGPIYSLHFAGGERALTRFNQMMAEAKQTPSTPPINQNN